MINLKNAARGTLSLALGDDRARLLLIQRAEASSKLTYNMMPKGRISQARLRALHNSHPGERCFIIGNGPSLKAMDLTPLRDEFTFGLNRIYLLFEKMGFATDCLVSVNRYVIEQCAQELSAQSGLKFFSWTAREYVRNADDVIFLRPRHQPGFATNPAHEGLWEGGTVTYVALQLAFLMGFSQVILIGVDHSFTTAGPPNRLVTATLADPNHFDGSYFGPGFRWQLPDLETSEIAYAMARRAFEADGRQVVDATINGKLEVFEKISFASLFTSGAAA